MHEASTMTSTVKTFAYRLDADVVRRAQLAKPDYLPLTAFLNLLLDQTLSGVDTAGRLNVPSRQAPGPSGGGTFIKGFNKEEDKERAHALPVEALRAEEAHVELTKVPKKKASHDIDPELIEFEPLIRAFWKAKKGAKTARSWAFVMSECKKILSKHGSDVLSNQLIQAEAQQWKGITLSNFEMYGLPPKAAGGMTDADYAALDAVVTPW